MRLAYLFAISLLVGVVGCGDDGGSGMIDAAVVIDAPPDAPAGLTGLGQRCGQGMPACPANAPGCYGTMTSGYCTPVCLMGGMGMTNAQGGIAINAITPAPMHATCMAAYTGTVGTPGCAAITSTTPMHNPLMPNTNYTQIQMVCVIACPNNGPCPPGFTCQANFCELN